MIMDVVDSASYGPVRQLWESCSTSSDAYSLYATLSRDRVSHVGVLEIYELSAPVEYMGSMWVGMLVEAAGTDLQSELQRRQAERNGWKEEEIIWVLRCLVDALSHAEQTRKFHLGINLSSIYCSGPRYKLGPLFTSNLQNQVQYFSHFLSPELKRMAYSGQWSAYDPTKADAYSVGVVLLAMALLYVPEGLSDLANLEANTRHLLASIAHYPALQWYVERLLAIREQDRPSFITLEAEFAEGSANSQVQASLRPPSAQQHQPTHCAICNAPITNSSWTTEIPAELHFLENFASSCCSRVCLYRFKELSLEQSFKSKVKNGAVNIASKVYNAANWSGLVTVGAKVFYNWVASKLGKQQAK